MVTGEDLLAEVIMQVNTAGKKVVTGGNLLAEVIMQVNTAGKVVVRGSISEQTITLGTGSER